MKNAKKHRIQPASQGRPNTAAQTQPAGARAHSSTPPACLHPSTFEINQFGIHYSLRPPVCHPERRNAERSAAFLSRGTYLNTIAKRFKSKNARVPVRYHLPSLCPLYYYPSTSCFLCTFFYEALHNCLKYRRLSLNPRISNFCFLCLLSLFAARLYIIYT